MTSTSTTSNTNIDVIRLWQLPDDFFTLSRTKQWNAMTVVTAKATPLSKPRDPCPLSIKDDILAVSFFLITLALPWLLFVVTIVGVYTQSRPILTTLGIFTPVLMFHPLPSTTNWRQSRLALALIRYFTMEVLVDRSNPALDGMATPSVDDPSYATTHLPIICLACPHGVFNYGAIIWCCISRWFVGWEQYTGAANVVKYVPGLRYMDRLIWVINADRESIVTILRERQSEERTGGMLGMVPDGILGAFRGRPGVDELIIGRKRGLMRIATEEGAIVMAAWFFGTTDMLTVVQDPWGVMEYVSRKMQAGMMGYYGRWYLPVPRRIAVTLCVAPYKCEKMSRPTKEQVEEVHGKVYGGLQKVYDEQKVYAGYPNRTLHIT